MSVVRRFLKESSRDEFDSAVYEAMLTPVQEKVLRLYVSNDVSVCMIATRLSCSESSVRRRLSEVYKKVSKTDRFQKYVCEKIGKDDE